MECGNDKAGIAQECRKQYPVTVYKGFLLLVPGFSIPSETDLADQATMQGYIAAGNIYPIQNLVSVEGEDTEGLVEDTPTQDKIFGWEGKRGAMYMALLPLDSHKIARTYNDTNWGVIYVDLNGVLVYTKNLDGSIGGFSTNLFHVWFLNTPGADAAVKTKIQIQEADIEELDTDGGYLNPTWNPKKLYGPLLVQISSTAVAANTFTSTLLYVNQSERNSDGTPKTDTTDVAGFSETDFVVIDQNGVTLNSASDYTVTEGDAGVYTIDATVGGMTSGSVQVKSTAAPFVKSAVETLTA